MSTNKIITTITFLLLNTIALFAQNVLSIPDVTVAAGETIRIPINLDNTEDVVAAQFTLTVPDGITLSPTSATMSERSNGHSVTMRRMASGKYMVMIFSSENKAISGRTGKIMTVNISAAASMQEDSQHEMSLSDVIIGARDGSNIVSSFNTGKIIIAPAPDLAVSNVSTDRQEFNPAERITVSWTVTNVGGGTTRGGWSEQITLVSTDGETTTLIGRVYHNEKLAIATPLTRQVDIELPKILEMDGNCRLQVKLIANSDAGEHSESTDNNVAHTDVTTGKKIYLSIPDVPIEENIGTPVRCKLSRSGNRDSEELFTLNCSDNARVKIPSTVTIPDKSSEVYFYAEVVDNDTIDGQTRVAITATNNDYLPVEAEMLIKDNEYPTLSVASSKSIITEGEKFTLTITTEKASVEPINITLTSEYSKKFSFPSQIIILPGEKETTVEVATVDDNIPDASVGATFYVSSTDCNNGETVVLLHDNDLPEIELTFAPDTVSESAGATAVVAILRRLTNSDKKATINLSDNSEGKLLYSTKSVTMDAGISEQQITIGVIDDNTINGEQKYTITAALYLTSCNCSAIGTNGGVVTRTLTILDDDAASLALASSKPMLVEGAEEATTLTITRNTDTSAPLVVTLTSSNDEKLIYERTVEIPVGESSVTTLVSVKGDDVVTPDQTVTFTAVADGHTKGTCWAMVTDNSYPDVIIDSLRVKSLTMEASSIAEIALTIKNDGVTTMPSNAKAEIYINNILTTTLYTLDSLEPGESTTLVKQVAMPATPGTHTLHATINNDKKIKELTYLNNTSEKVLLTLLSQYTLTANTDKAIYQSGETIKISGEATGTNTTNAQVEIYIINSGVRRTMTTTTDATGKYSVTWKPYRNQSGHFVVGACQPGENSMEEQTAFDVYGLKLATTSPILCETFVDEPYNGVVPLVNPGQLALTNIKAEIISAPEGCSVEFTPIEKIEGDATANLAFTINSQAPSTASDWEHIKVRVTTAEGASADITLYYYSCSPKGLLKANITGINTTATKGTYRDYSFTITNVGAGKTGKITLALPDVEWMSAVTSKEMTSLEQGEATTVILRLSPTEDMQLNVPRTGKIGINCENGTGLSLNYKVEAVSQTTGTLVVDVCDEYTYYTAEAPHLAGAKVVLRHPVTKELVFEGTTGPDGLYKVELPEGYYQLEVSADKHDTYTNTILVDPGKETPITVDLSFQAITVDWDVQETEVKDEYRLVSTVKYETNVPAPVVILNIPERIDGDNMAAGESTLVYFTVTNKGLVTAFNVQVYIPENSAEWKFEALENAGPFNLAAHQAVTIPVLITHLTDGTSSSRSKSNISRAGGYNYFGSCMAQASAAYEIICGKTIKTNKYTQTMALKMCGTAAIGATILDVLNDIYRGGWGRVNPPSYVVPPTNNVEYKPVDKKVVVTTGEMFSLCDTCDAQKASDLVEVVIGLSSLSTLNDAANMAIEDINRMKEGKQSEYKITITKEALKSLISEIAKANSQVIEIGFGVIEWIENVKDLVDALTKECPSTQNKKSKLRGVEYASERSWQEQLNVVGKEFSHYISLVPAMMGELFGDSVWFDRELDAKVEFFNYLVEHDSVTLDELLLVKPDDVTDEQVEALVNRIENFATGASDDNTIDINLLDSLSNEAATLNEAAMRAGYESLYAQFVDAHETAMDFYRGASSSVCASVTLQFSQEMTMTRQAFRGTLTVFNGHETKAMENVKLILDVTDENGTTATSREFQINVEGLSQFDGALKLDGGWSLQANEKGIATILFIPTKYAAPTEDVKYSFGGRLLYLDPFTGLEVTRNLTPVTMTVKPSPQLDLTYFMQRDIYGDDPLTTAVEPIKEAEFSLLINNVGNGIAKDVRMMTEQPKIIDNEKGLLVNFEILGSLLNGKEKSMAMGGDVATDFGTIAPGNTAYAQWWLTSTLLGHFVDYDVEATHVTSYDNPELTLLNNVTIRELIRSLNVVEGPDTMVGFMVNDIGDAYDLPDMLYLSNGEVEKVQIAASSNISKISDNEYLLSVTPSDSGWNYGHISDPTYGVAELDKIIRKSDNREISLRNIWQTDRTLRDGKEPLYENRIHFADKFAALAGEEYLLIFKPSPSPLLEVQSFVGVPAAEDVCTKQLTDITLLFNKEINDTTFTVDDITLTCQGNKVDNADITIEKISVKEYKLILSEVTLNDGYYVLTVQTAGIIDGEGFYGKSGKQAAWTQFVHGKLPLKVAISPVEGGTVSHTSGYYPCDTTIVVKAVPAEAYTFSHWMVNADTYSNDTVCNLTLTDDTELTAVFAKKFYKLTIECDTTKGVVNNAATGIYEYGSEFTLKAEPLEDCVFEGWTVNGVAGGTQDTLCVKMDTTLNVMANYKRVRYHQKQKVYKGWNWLSSYIGDEISIDVFESGVNRVLTQISELIRDPELGLVGDITSIKCGEGYKIEAIYSSLRTMSGVLHNTEKTPIVLRKGWNWISYPYNEERTISSVIQNPEEGDFIVSQEGFTEYADGYWEGTIQNFVPGAGYIYKSMAKKELAFNFVKKSSQNRLKARNMQSVTYGHEVDIRKYPSTMNVTARMYKDNMEYGDETCILYAMDGNECRGIGKLIGKNYYITIYGDKPVDISFIVENTSTGDTYLANETLQFSEDVVGSRKSPYTITIDNPTGINSVDDGKQRMKVYSIEGVLIEPAADKEALKRLPKGIYIIDGKKYRINK